jgi:hypothetical protein
VHREPKTIVLKNEEKIDRIPRNFSPLEVRRGEEVRK